MDTANVFRVISLIPDRAPRAQSGCAFAPEGQSERIALLARFLHWLGPLDSLSKEEQQLLGLRSNHARPLEEELEPGEMEEPEQPPVPLPGAGTQIAV